MAKPEPVTVPDFDPRKHLIQLKGKLYLETKYRIQWFRQEHPSGCITTEIINLDPVLVKATVFTADGSLLSSSHAGAVDKGNAVWSGREVEKAETAAIGRALAIAGYGTQFAGDDEVAPYPQRAAASLGQGNNRRIPPTGEGEWPLYEIKGIRLNPLKGDGNFSYVLMTTQPGANIVLYTGDLLREAGLDVDSWKEAGKVLPYEGRLTAIARYADGRWEVKQIARVVD